MHNHSITEVGGEWSKMYTLVTHEQHGQAIFLA